MIGSSSTLLVKQHGYGAPVTDMVTIV